MKLPAFFSFLIVGYCSVLFGLDRGYALAAPLDQEIEDFGQALQNHLKAYPVAPTRGFHLPNQGVTILLQVVPGPDAGWWAHGREGSKERYEALAKRVQSLKGRRDSNLIALQAQLHALRAQLEIFRSFRAFPWSRSITAVPVPGPAPHALAPPAPPPPPAAPPPPPLISDDQLPFPQWTEEDWRRFDAEVESLEQEIISALEQASDEQVYEEDLERQVTDKLIEGIATEGTRLRSLAPDEYVNIVWLDSMRWHGRWGSLQHSSSESRTFSVLMSDILAVARGEVDLETFKGRVRRSQDGPQ